MSSSERVGADSHDNACVIEVIDDDHSDGADDASVVKVESPPIEPNASGNSMQIKLLMEILHLSDRRYAADILERFDFDVQRAVTHVLTEQESRSRDKSVPTKRSLFTSSTKDSHIKRPRPLAQPSDAKRPEESFDHLPFSPAWHKVYQETPLGSYFVDPDFRPGSSSIDGRERSNEPTLGLTIRCHCGILARPMRVQSEGPDYGRFYLACGNKGGSRRRPRVLPERQSPSTRHETQDTSAVLAPAADKTNQSTTVIQNPYANSQRVTARAPPSTPPQRHSCSFFQWDRNGAYGAILSDAYAMGRFQRFSWKHFGLETSHVMSRSFNRNKSRSHCVQQGSIGNCWFLSALAVVAEQPYLIERVLKHDTLNEKGVYEVNLCLDGKWTPVLVDSYLPVVEMDQHADRVKKSTQTSPKHRKESPKRTYMQQTLSGAAATATYRTAFCATPDKQIWAALIEKAYAKAHGSYANLSGGFIAEGLTDLTGAPTETILFNESALLHQDELWARLASFAEAGFIMGVATAGGGDGLVGGHAYSVLQVIEIPGLAVGEQAKVTDFFEPTSGCEGKTEKIHENGRHQLIRLLRIRNPWGKREWKGEWSADSERWTKALRNRLGSCTYAKGDGVFFMSLDDTIKRFHHLDVAKTRQGWVYTSIGGSFRNGCDPICSSEYAYKLTATNRTWAFLSLIQPKKRSYTNWRYYYCDISFILLKRKHGDKNWICETVMTAGVKRSISVEIFFDPNSYEYVCLPFSCMAKDGDGFSFHLTVYSANLVELRRANEVREYPVAATLHKDLLSRDHKLIYYVAPSAMLSCVHGDGCLYFIAINGSTNAFLSLKLVIEIQAGNIVIFGKETETYDVAPSSQQVLAVVCGNGRFSNGTSISFRFLSSQVEVSAQSSNFSCSNGTSRNTLGCSVPLTMAGDLLVSRMLLSEARSSGGDTVDTCLWIPQIGASMRESCDSCKNML